MEDSSANMQDIAEQRAILESIRLYESDQQYKLAINRSLVETKSKVKPSKKLPPAPSTPPAPQESSDSDNVNGSDAESIFEDFSSDEEDPTPPESKSNINNDDLIKRIKDELRLEILDSLKKEAANISTNVNKIIGKKK
jgi:hypothetical protein